MNISVVVTKNNPPSSPSAEHKESALMGVRQTEGRAAEVQERLTHIDALAELAKTSPEALKALGEIYRAGNGLAEEVRSAAGRSLRDLGAVGELTEALQSKEESLRLSAATLLGEIGPGASAALPTLLLLERRAEFRQLKESWSGTLGEPPLVGDHGREVYKAAIIRIAEK